MGFPTSLDTFTFPAAGDSLNTVGVLHTDQHGSANSAISALEARVGIDNSTNPTSLNYKASALSASGFALSASASANKSGISAQAVSAALFNSAISALTAAGTIDPGHHHTNTSLDSLAVSKLVTGGYKMAVQTISGNYTAASTDDLIRSSGDITATLSGAAGLGKFYYVKNISGTALVSASGSDTIDGVGTAQLTATNQFAMFCDATAGRWDIL